jgi:hypothetical protein
VQCLDRRTDIQSPFTGHVHAVVSKGQEQTKETLSESKWQLWTLLFTVVLHPRPVSAVMTDIKGMELRLTGTFDGCS